MNGILQIFNAYDEVVASLGGITFSKISSKWVRSIFKNWRGEIAKFVQALGLFLAGLYMYDTGQKKNNRNFQFFGLGFAVESASNMIEALTNESLDGIVESVVGGNSSTVEGLPEQNYLMQGVQPDFSGTLADISVPIVDDDDLDDDLDDSIDIISDEDDDEQLEGQTDLALQPSYNNDYDDESYDAQTVDYEEVYDIV